jgi:hypothetical protein
VFEQVGDVCGFFSCVGEGDSFLCLCVCFVVSAVWVGVVYVALLEIHC